MGGGGLCAGIHVSNTLPTPRLPPPRRPQAKCLGLLSTATNFGNGKGPAPTEAETCGCLREVPEGTADSLECRIDAAQDLTVKQLRNNCLAGERAARGVHRMPEGGSRREEGASAPMRPDATPWRLPPCPRSSGAHPERHSDRAARKAGPCGGR